MRILESTVNAWLFWSNSMLMHSGLSQQLILCRQSELQRLLHLWGRASGRRAARRIDFTADA